MRYFIGVFLFLAFNISTCFATSAVPPSFADLVEDLTPSVVNISTTQTISESPMGEFKFNVPKGSPFEEFFEQFEDYYGQNHEEGAERKATSLGSGFVIDESGYIVTNNHVIDQAEEITVIFSDDTEAKAKIVGRDKKLDIALLKVDVKRKLKSVKWGDSNTARVGDWVVAIGNPFGLGGSVSAGIISARARDINSGPFDDFIQTDAAINRGNSGGPLFSSDGKVIGINTAIVSPSGGNVGIGFALPSTLVQPVITQLKTSGKVERAWLGVKIQTVTPDIAESLNLKKPEGALVVEVTKDGPAYKGGIKSGDIITSFDGNKVSAMRKLPRMVAESSIGKAVDVLLQRNGKTLIAKVTLGKLKDTDEETEQKADNSNMNDFSTKGELIQGMRLANLDKNLREYFGIDKSQAGVIITDVAKKSDAEAKNLAPGDIIENINQRPVQSVKDAIGIISEAKKQNRKSVLLLINRKGETKFIAISLK